MILSDNQRRICEQVIIAFESALADRKYGSVTTNNDGPHQAWQISYGRSQSSEYGNLEELLAMYANSNGQYSSAIKEYLPGIGVASLANNAAFIRLLQEAGSNDPVMQLVQDQFFHWQYFRPAMRWMDENGFVLPLTALVVYDSFIQSGTIFRFLRKRFPEKLPCNGGNEKTWTKQYVETRHNWFTHHDNEIARNDIYRTAFFLDEIARKNWMLSQLPVIACERELFG